MKRVYIGIDGETDTILTVGFSKTTVLEELFQIDVYFPSKQEFLARWHERYLIEVWTVEEEKEMEKFAKITGYAGTGEKDKEVGLSIGSVYELVEYGPQGNSYIYLNEDTPRYYVADTQFTLVSKPPFKIGDKVRVLSNRSLATDENKLYYNDGDIAVVGEVHWLGVNESYGRVRLGTHKCGNWIDFNCIELVDEQQENQLVEMQQKLNNKIKLLKEERGRIIDKIERLDNHQRALKSKIDRLSDADDALKILKDFK